MTEHYKEELKEPSHAMMQCWEGMSDADDEGQKKGEFASEQVSVAMLSMSGEPDLPHHDIFRSEVQTPDKAELQPVEMVTVEEVHVKQELFESGEDELHPERMTSASMEEEALSFCQENMSAPDDPLSTPRKRVLDRLSVNQDQETFSQGIAPSAMRGRGRGRGRARGRGWGEGRGRGRGRGRAAGGDTAEGRQKKKYKTIWALEPYRLLCGTCGKAFKKNSHLERHTLIHTGERPFACGVCDCAFTMAAGLRHHFNVAHTTERPFPCEVADCGRAFVDRPTLTKHYRIVHSELRPYQCRGCSEAFKQKGDLTRHMRKHTGDRPYNCPHCTWSCSRPDNLRQHVKNRHKNKASDIKCRRRNKVVRESDVVADTEDEDEDEIAWGHSVSVVEPSNMERRRKAPKNYKVMAEGDCSENDRSDEEDKDSDGDSHWEASEREDFEKNKRQRLEEHEGDKEGNTVNITPARDGVYEAVKVQGTVLDGAEGNQQDYVEDLSMSAADEEKVS